MPPPPHVTCVVLNYNGWPDTVACIESLLKQDYGAFAIVVVDNASTDGSVERIRSAFPQLLLIESPDNDGFSAGNNLGIRHALAQGAEFIWLLNNDTVAPPETCANLVAAAAGPKTGIVGTVLYYQHDPAKIQAWGGGELKRSIGFGRHFTGPTDLGPESFVTFASVLLRADMLCSTGLLDPGYFMYFEDSDLCFRARTQGWQIVVAADTAVLHKEGGSAGGPANTNAPADPVRVARTARIVTASGMRFLQRYGEPRWLAPWLYLGSRLSKRALRGDIGGAAAVLRGMRDWMRGTPTAFQKRP